MATTLVDIKEVYNETIADITSEFKKMAIVFKLCL